MNQLILIEKTPFYIIKINVLKSTKHFFKKIPIMRRKLERLK